MDSVMDNGAGAEEASSMAAWTASVESRPPTQPHKNTAAAAINIVERLPNQSPNETVSQWILHPPINNHQRRP
eukprot:CCRYP_016674-RA/>CCRYP_016674-RA protein AED:0.43 eAED:0.47 QI:0/0/0/1/0/0/2/724/72